MGCECRLCFCLGWAWGKTVRGVVIWGVGVGCGVGDRVLGVGDVW